MLHVCSNRLQERRSSEIFLRCQPELNKAHRQNTNYVLLGDMGIRWRGEREEKKHSEGKIHVRFQWKLVDKKLLHSTLIISDKLVRMCIFSS